MLRRYLISLRVKGQLQTEVVQATSSTKALIVLVKKFNLHGRKLDIVNLRVLK